MNEYYCVDIVRFMDDIRNAHVYLSCAAFMSVLFVIPLIGVMGGFGCESPCETSLNRKSTVQKVMAILSWILAIFYFGSFIYVQSEISHQIDDCPVEEIRAEIKFILIKISLAKSALSCSFFLTGLGAYSFWFRKSNRPVWKKVLRVVYILLLFAAYNYAIDYSKPDVIKYVMMFLSVMFICYNLGPINTSATKENMGKQETGGGSVETPEGDAPQSGQKFCKHCGKPIANDSDTFCQHCGGKIEAH